MNLMEAAERALLDDYGLPAVSVATARWLRHSMRRFVEYLGDDLDTDMIRPRALMEWRQYELERGLSPITVNSYLRGVKLVFSRLAKRGELPRNPAAGVRYVSEPPPRPKAISLEDYLAMREAADEPRDRAIVDVLWSSGCRLGGLLSMRVDRMEHWVTGDGGHCFAALVTEKGEKTRWIYIGAEREAGEGLHEYLVTRPPSSHRQVFLTTVRPWRPVSAVAVEHVLRRLKVAAGIPHERPANPHSFRHAFAIRRLNEGDDLPAVSALLGHYSPEFTGKVYVVRSERELRDKYFKT